MADKPTDAWIDAIARRVREQAGGSTRTRSSARPEASALTLAHHTCLMWAVPGVQAGDAMAKKASVAQIVSRTVHYGKHLVMVSGEVGDVEEFYTVGH